jgi:hypothetical protein|tara:strand:- start:96 stop:320 length:225 start_codon:yes stop_codon:yes gene_type:complete
MKVITTYPHRLIKLTQIIDYTPWQKIFFIDECEGREVWSTVEGKYQRTIEITNYVEDNTNKRKTIDHSKNGVQN